MSDDYDDDNLDDINAAEPAGQHPVAPAASTTVPSETPLESYRPEMLPHNSVPETPPASGPRHDAFVDIRRDLMPQPVRRHYDDAQETAPSLRREPGTSLRESILKKPLSSLYKRD